VWNDFKATDFCISDSQLENPVGYVKNEIFSLLLVRLLQEQREIVVIKQHI
jgi:hypothetical protein